MDILIKYGSDERLNPELLDEIRTISRKYGKLSEKTWRVRVGAIDLVTILEVVGVYMAMKIVDGFVEGVVGKDWFTELGKRTRSVASTKLQEFSSYLSELFSKVIRGNRNRYGAIAIIEYIDDVTLYVVLNHKRMNSNLASSLPIAIARVFREISANGLPEDSARVVQLYPNFETESWDYLFVPTTSTFGYFIDRYLDLQDGQYYFLHSIQDFRDKFCPDDFDLFKFLINTSSSDGYPTSIFDKL